MGRKLTPARPRRFSSVSSPAVLTNPSRDLNVSKLNVFNGAAILEKSAACFERINAIDPDLKDCLRPDYLLCAARSRQLQASHLDLCPDRPPGQITIQYKQHQAIGKNDFYFIVGIGQELQDLGAKLAGNVIPGPGLWPTMPAAPATSNLHELTFLKKTTNACCLNETNHPVKRAALQLSAIWDVFLFAAQKLVPTVPLFMVRIWTPIIVSETNHHNNIDFTLEHPKFATSEYNTYLSMVDAGKWGSLRTPTYFILGLPTAATRSLATFFVA